MDTIPLPTRKDKGHIIRASKRQSEILLNLFSQNPVASPESVKSVSEETGLPIKWINSWFVRQRRKARGALPMDAIDKFKAEYQDPILVDARDDGTTQSDNIPVRAKTHPRRSNKVKTERKDVENDFPILTSLPPPFPEVSSDKMEIPNPAPLSSKFILREMVPRVWMPPGPHRPPILAPPTLDSSSTPTAQNRCRPHFSAYTTPQIQISNARTTVLQPTFHNNVFPASPFSDTHIPTITPLRTQNDISDPPRLPASGPKRSQPAYQRQQQQQQSRPHRASNLGPGRITDRKLQARFNVPLSAPSIFTTELESSSHLGACPVPTNDGHQLSELTTPPVAGLVPVLPCNPRPPQQDYYSLLDPSMTPLKYLTVLEPFERCVGADGAYAALQQNVVFDRLLDENLVRIDPFQAAMGLVFLSRLGLKWEY